MRTDTDTDQARLASSEHEAEHRALRPRWLGPVAVAVAVAIAAAGAWVAAQHDDEPVAALGAPTAPTVPQSSTVTTQHAPPTTAPVATLPPATAMYTGAAYPLTLEYPAGWQQVADDPTPSFEGTDGFFAIDGTASPGSVEDVCGAQAAQTLQPFGTSPTIEALTVDGQEGCLILPSADQPESMRDAARLVARLPYELFSVGYNFLVLDADTTHIRSIVASLRFLGQD